MVKLLISIIIIHIGFLHSPYIYETPKTKNVGLWYTGCYINEEDACLLDQMKNATSFSFSETEIFDDLKAVKIENITVRVVKYRYIQ